MADELKTELLTDPLVRGYAGMDDQAADVLFRFALPTPRVETVQNRGKESDAALPEGAKGPLRGKRAEGGTPGKVGRNDPCPCGSGKKYKKCCAT